MQGSAVRDLRLLLTHSVGWVNEEKKLYSGLDVGGGEGRVGGKENSEVCKDEFPWAVVYIIFTENISVWILNLSSSYSNIWRIYQNSAAFNNTKPAR